MTRGHRILRLHAGGRAPGQMLQESPLHGHGTRMGWGCNSILKREPAIQHRQAGPH